MGNSHTCYVKFYAHHHSEPNYLYTFKVKDYAEALRRVPYINRHFKDVRAIYFKSALNNRRIA